LGAGAGGAEVVSTGWGARGHRPQSETLARQIGHTAQLQRREPERSPPDCVAAHPDESGWVMSSETLMLSVCLAVAFGGVPLATVIHAHVVLTRAARHVAEIETLAASRTLDVEDISRLGVLELQAIAQAAAEELRDRRDDGARGDFRTRGDRRRDWGHSPSRPLAKAG
jgi:hypothetical protein